MKKKLSLRVRHEPIGLLCVHGCSVHILTWLLQGVVASLHVLQMFVVQKRVPGSVQGGQSRSCRQCGVKMLVEIV
jgi:hypothetical protein